MTKQTQKEGSQDGARSIRHHRTLLQQCRQRGIRIAFAELSDSGGRPSRRPS
ncbi:hypothetical protein QUF64_09525 [Anaerolineales bacterium HSG6]|nr:hypothetical protein [Anaerolineales bacterium HSG6]MDM8532163.1 hypothetical protein [Anaerolineales bacterium HSG25]